jgi:hypothetical protein
VDQEGAGMSELANESSIMSELVNESSIQRRRAVTSHDGPAERSEGER